MNIMVCLTFIIYWFSVNNLPPRILRKTFIQVGKIHLYGQPVVFLFNFPFNYHTFYEVNRLSAGSAVKIDGSLVQIPGVPIPVPPPQIAETGTFEGQFHRSEEHTSELQSLMPISYAVFCLKKNT